MQNWIKMAKLAYVLPKLQMDACQTRSEVKLALILIIPCCFTDCFYTSMIYVQDTLCSMQYVSILHISSVCTEAHQM